MAALCQRCYKYVYMGRICTRDIMLYIRSQIDYDVTINTRAVNIPETLFERSDRVVKLYQQHTQILLVFIY